MLFSTSESSSGPSLLHGVQCKALIKTTTPWFLVKCILCTKEKSAWYILSSSLESSNRAPFIPSSIPLGFYSNASCIMHHASCMISSHQTWSVTRVNTSSKAVIEHLCPHYRQHNPLACS